jgi:hypothetical protein
MANVDWEMRAPLGSAEYWRKWLDFSGDWIAKTWQIMESPAGDPSYAAQYRAKQSQRHLEQMLRLYSAGAPIASLAPWFEGLLEAWEKSQALEPSCYPPEIVHSRRTWAINFDLYGECVWLTGEPPRFLRRLLRLRMEPI